MAYLCVHFLAVLAYAFPVKDQNKFKFYVFPYIYPYFHQDWSMFVPVPKQNFNLYVRYEHDGANTEWEDLFYTVNSAHQTNRLKGNEGLLLAVANSLRYYASSVKNESKLEKDDGTNINFEVIKNICTQYLYHRNGTEPQKLQVLIGITDVETNSRYFHYYKLNN